MSPHKVEVLPSIGALSSYGISRNGFLPAEAPLVKLPHSYYEPWECIVAELPILIETQAIRSRVSEIPVLSTSQLTTEAEWQRAYTMLALIAQGYVWVGPEPSEVSWNLFDHNTIHTADSEGLASCNHHPSAEDCCPSRSLPDRNVRWIQPVELAANCRRIGPYRTE